MLNIFNKKPKYDANTFFVWEPCSKSHGIIVPGYAKYLLDLGYNVSVLVTPEHIKGGLFKYFNDERLTLNKLSQKQIRKFFKQNDLSGVKGVMVTTATKLTDGKPDYDAARNFFKGVNEPGRPINTSTEPKSSKVLLVEHEIKQARDAGVCVDDLIMLRKMNYKGANPAPVSPHYFGDVKITPKNSTCHNEKDLGKTQSHLPLTNFITIGTIRAKRKNTNIIIDAVKALHAKGVTNFKVTVVGKGSLRALPREIRRYFDIKGYLGFAQMYDEIEKADFMLTAYEPDNPAHQRYITTGTSGNFLLVYGFVKPCLITRSFAPINGFDEGNSVLYDDYVEGMQRAIAMSAQDYAKMQENLKNYADALYKESLENLKGLINEV